jgi:hypothetical protein
MLNFLGPLSKVYEKIHDSVDEWNSPAPIANCISSLAEEVVEFLDQVPGMTPTYSADLKRSTPRFTLRDGSVLRVWRNPVGYNYVFIADCDGSMVFGGFVDWVHTDGLNNAIASIKREFT